MTAAITDIEKLAAKVAHEVLTDSDLSLGERLGALKVLAPYYTLLKKITPNEDTSEDNFEDFQAAMHGEENNATKPAVRDYPRTGNSGHGTVSLA